MKEKNKQDTNFPDDKSSDEIINLLKEGYNPDLNNEMQEFDNFYAELEQKIHEQNPVNKINQVGKEINSNFYVRQMKLENLEKNLEQKKLEISNKKINRIEFNYSKVIVAAFFILLILTLTGIATQAN